VLCVKQTYDTDSSSNTLIEATQNPHDGWDKSNKENEVEQTDVEVFPTVGYMIFEIAQLWILIFLLHFLIVLYILYLRSFPLTSEYVVLKVFYI
jgi:hypothetical protein